MPWCPLRGPARPLSLSGKSRILHQSPSGPPERRERRQMVKNTAQGNPNPDRTGYESPLHPQTPDFPRPFPWHEFRVCPCTHQLQHLEGVPEMGPYRKLWFTLIAVLAVTFSLLGFYGGEVYRRRRPSRSRGRGRRATPVRPRRHPGRADRLAVGGRHAAGLGLGPRRLPGAGLDRGLAAPRAERLAGPGRARGHGQPYAELPAPAQARCAKPSRPSTAATASTRTRC